MAPGYTRNAFAYNCRRSESVDICRGWTDNLLYFNGFSIRLSVYTYTSGHCSNFFGGRY